MNDFILLIDYFFNLLNQLVQLCQSNWLLSWFMVLGLFGLLVGLIVQISPKQ